MKKIAAALIIIASASLIIPACDIVDEPYLVKTDDGTGPAPDTVIRKVLLEEFTGQKCVNCPEAAGIASDLKIIYGEQLVLLTIHAGFFSVPDPSGDFTADFRTPEGSEIYSSFVVPTVPTGMVNRTEYNGNTVMLNDSWESAVDVQSKLPAQADIVITNTYSTGTRRLDCQLETEFLENLEGTYNICVFLIENGIISPQQTEQGVNLTYEHNHVLRTSMNGTWGEAVGTDGQAVTGSTLTNNYSYTLPVEWNADNCAVVAFIYNTETLEVVQAEELEF